jgi:phospholipase/carboxylesterase
MWVFSKDIPQDYWVISPRAPFSAGEKGYSWRNFKQDGNRGLLNIMDFHKTLLELTEMLKDWSTLNSVIFRSIDMIGFSQGAALVCAFLLSDLMKIKRAACLAGFMPDGGSEMAQPGILVGTKIFVSHGSGDEIIPLARGKEMVRILEFAGADVDLCAEDVGHKVGIHCSKGLKNFFSK